MAEVPDVQYARSGGIAVAYQVVGDGPQDLVFLPFLSNLYSLWQLPVFAAGTLRLAESSRLILVNTRGRAIVAAMPSLGLQIRVGIHTGECERVGEKLAGLAVNVGARVAATAGAGEVLVSGTVRDLVAGSGFAFDDLGEHELKGVPGS